MYDPKLIRECTRPVRSEPMYRIVRNEYRDPPLSAARTPSRFCRYASSYSVLYAAETIWCCFREAVIRDRFKDRRRRELPRSEIDSRAVIIIELTEPLLLVGLSPDNLFRINAPTAVVHDRRWPAGQALSAATYDMVPEADGFLYPSLFTSDRCVAVFDRAIRKLQVLSIAPLAEYDDVYRALSDYGIDLTTPA